MPSAFTIITPTRYGPQLPIQLKGYGTNLGAFLETPLFRKKFNLIKDDVEKVSASIAR